MRPRARIFGRALLYSPLIAALLTGAAAPPASAISLPWGKKKAAPKAQGPSPEQRRKELGAKSLEILKKGLESEDVDVRVIAAEQWGELGNPAAVPVLKRALRDTNRYVQIAAAKSLFKLGSKDGAPVLAAIINERPEPAKKKGAAAALEEMRAISRNKIRVAAVKALAGGDEAGALPILTKAAEDEEPSLQEAIAVALGRLGRAEVVDAFAQALESQDEQERAAAARSMGEIGRPSALRYLEPYAKDESPVVRAAVMEAYGLIGDPSALNQIEPRVKDQNALVRAKAVEALGKLSNRDAVAVLKDVHDTSQDAYLKLLAIAGMAKLGAGVELGVAQRTFGQPDTDIRLLAVQVLETVGNENAIEILEFAVDDTSSPAVRLRVAAALVKLLQRKAAEK